MTFRNRSNWEQGASDYKEVLSRYNYRTVEIDGDSIDLIDVNSLDELIELQTELKKQPNTQWGIVINDGEYFEYKEIKIYDNYLE